MCSKRYLRRVTYGCVVVTYGARQRSPKSRAPQPCTQIAAAFRPSAGCRRADGKGLRSFSSSSLSLLYLQQARRLKQPVPIADAKIAFTVKLSQKLVRRLRALANRTGLSLSELVSRALLAVLPERPGRG